MGYTPDILLEKVGGDLELALELLEAYHEDAPQRLATLAEAIERENTEQASQLAHSLKGMSGVVRAEEVAKLALAMELAGRSGDQQRLEESLAMLRPMLAQVLDDIGAFMAANGDG